MSDSAVAAHRTERSISPRLKLTVELAAIPAILLINLLVRRVTDSEQVLLVATAIPSAAIAAMEYLTWKRQAPGDRVKAAVHGSFYRPAVEVVIYVVVILQLLQQTLAFLAGMGVGYALADRGVSDQAVAEIATEAAGFVIVPVTAVAIIFLARSAAYRLKEHPFAWMSLALGLDFVVSLFTGIALSGADHWALVVMAIVIRSSLFFGAAWIGVRWAQRTQALHVLHRAYRNLSPENRDALVELALPKVEPRP
jgi:hypothetical protein